MKKLLMIAAFAGTAFTSSAQFAKGDMFASGSVGYSSLTDNNNDTKQTSFSFSPSVGYFITNNLSLEGELLFGQETFEEVNLKTINDNSMGFGIASRYYFTPANKFSFFGRLGAAYVTINDKVNKFKTNAFVVGVSPAISYFVSDKFAMQATIGSINYSTTSFDVSGSKSVNGLDLNFNLSNIAVGLNYKF